MPLRGPTIVTALSHSFIPTRFRLSSCILFFLTQCALLNFAEGVRIVGRNNRPRYSLLTLIYQFVICFIVSSIAGEEFSRFHDFHSPKIIFLHYKDSIGTTHCRPKQQEAVRVNTKGKYSLCTIR